jgi:hypothetical protein
LIRKVFKVQIKDDRDTKHGYGYGDTYHKYCERCRLAQIEPESFNTWLRFELSVVIPRGKPGPAVHLDAYQQLQA